MRVHAQLAPVQKVVHARAVVAVVVVAVENVWRNDIISWRIMLRVPGLRMRRMLVVYRRKQWHLIGIRRISDKLALRSTLRWHLWVWSRWHRMGHNEITRNWGGCGAACACGTMGALVVEDADVGVPELGAEA